MDKRRGVGVSGFVICFARLDFSPSFVLDLLNGERIRRGLLTVGLRKLRTRANSYSVGTMDKIGLEKSTRFVFFDLASLLLRSAATSSCSTFSHTSVSNSDLGGEKDLSSSSTTF